MSTYLLAWNPNRWHWYDLDERAAAVARGETVDERWSTGNNRRIERGDRVFIIRLGQEPRGIFASGTVSTGSFQGPHYDPDRAARGDTTYHIHVTFDTLLDPEHDPPLAIDILQNDPRLRAMHWPTQKSGVTIPEPVAAALEETWAAWLTDHQVAAAPTGAYPESITKPTGRIFGHIPGYPPGSTFANRQELSAAGVHPPNMAGISGSQTDGADSIVLSGGYEDDEDEGDLIIYTGHGGNDPETGTQIADQTLTRQNLALAISAQKGLPIRVTRGANLHSPYAPQTGFRYDGLYFVDSFWSDRGKSGHLIWRYRLRKIDSAPTPSTEPETTAAPERREVTIARVIRNTPTAQRVKELYDYRCQVCGIRLQGAAGPYAEAAHIRPLGRPHNGPDTRDNILCLCPNHHILFDYHGFTIADDLTLIGIEGTLHTHPRHTPNPAYLAYHREHYHTRTASD